MTSAVELLKHIQYERNDKIHFYMDKSEIGYADLVDQKCLDNKIDQIVDDVSAERAKHPEKYGEDRWDRRSK